jgi:hypothetical protein
MSAVFAGLNPRHVFELWLQLASLNYRQLVRQPDGSVLDLARPAEAQPKGVSLVALAEQLAAIPALEYVPTMPATVNWNAWDWQKMETKPGGYTEICLVVRVRTHGPVEDRARIWWAACSLIPDQPGRAVFVRYDRMDHHNIIIAPADDVLAFVERIRTL